MNGSQWRQFQGGRVRHWIVAWPSINTSLHVYVALCGKTSAWLRSTDPIDGAPAARGYCVECERRRKAAGRESDK